MQFTSGVYRAPINPATLRVAQWQPADRLSDQDSESAALNVRFAPKADIQGLPTAPRMADALFDRVQQGFERGGMLLGGCVVTRCDAICSRRHGALKFCPDFLVARIGERALTLLGARIRIGFIELGIQGPDQAVHCVTQVHAYLDEVGRRGGQTGMLGRGGDLGLGIGISGYGECQQCAEYGGNCYYFEHRNLP